MVGRTEPPPSPGPTWKWPLGSWHRLTSEPGARSREGRCAPEGPSALGEGEEEGGAAPQAALPGGRGAPDLRQRTARLPGTARRENRSLKNSEGGPSCHSCAQGHSGRGRRWEGPAPALTGRPVGVACACEATRQRPLVPGLCPCVSMTGVERPTRLTPVQGIQASNESLSFPLSLLQTPDALASPGPPDTDPGNPPP